MHPVVIVGLLLFLASTLSAYVGLKIGPVYELNRKCCESSRLTSLLFALKEKAGLINFYSQVGQDRWIVQKVFPGVKNGYFVDVGSGDGIYASNTKILEELGWKGVCIDPFPENIETRTCAMFREVVDSEAGRKVQFRAARGYGGINEYLHRWKKRVEQRPLVEFTTTTLESILARAKAPSFIHYMSIDIEGAELAALKAFPFSNYKVGAFTIEHAFDEAKRSQIRELLERNGYRSERTVSQDDFYLPK